MSMSPFSLFDTLRAGRKRYYMASVVRSVINSAINYFEIVLCFGVFYYFGWQQPGFKNDWTNAYYFSAVTQLTVGFGQTMPLGWLKLVALFQFIIGYAFTVLIISRFIGLLPSSRTIAGDGQADDD